MSVDTKAILMAFSLLAGQTNGSALAQNSLNQQREAIDIINDEADRICYVVQLEGSSQTEKASGQIDVEVGGLFRRLANIGVSGNGSMGRDRYKGVLQQDLALALHDSSDCKLKVLAILSPRLLPTATSPLPSPSQPSSPSFSPNSVPLASACRPFPSDLIDSDNMFDARTRQLMPLPNVPRLQQPAVVRVRFNDQRPNALWTGFLVSANKAPPQLSPTAVMVMVIAGSELAFAGFCEIGQQFNINLSNRMIVGRLDSSNDFSASVSFQDGH